MYLRCYGNGPATVTGIGVHCANAAPTKDTPLDVVKLDGTNIGLAPDNRWLYPESEAAYYKTTKDRLFVYGYARYRDQFKTRISRFTVKLGVKDGKVTMETAGDPAWSRFDESAEEK